MRKGGGTHLDSFLRRKMIIPAIRAAKNTKLDAKTAGFQGGLQVLEAAALTLTTEVMAGAGIICVTNCVTILPPTVVTEAMVVGIQDVTEGEKLVSVGEVDNATNVVGVGDDIKGVSTDDARDNTKDDAGDEVRDDSTDDTAVDNVDERVDDVVNNVVDDGAGNLVDQVSNEGNATSAVVHGTVVVNYIKVLA